MTKYKQHQKKRLTFAIVALVASMLQLLLPSSALTATTLTLFWAANLLGLIMLGEYLSIRYLGISLLIVVRKNRRNTILFLLVTTLSGVMLEGFAQWLSKLWYYPFFRPGSMQSCFCQGSRSARL